MIISKEAEHELPCNSPIRHSARKLLSPNSRSPFSVRKPFILHSRIFSFYCVLALQDYPSTEHACHTNFNDVTFDITPSRQQSALSISHFISYIDNVPTAPPADPHSSVLALMLELSSEKDEK